MIGLFIFLALAGVILWLLPMEPAIKSVAVKIVIVVAVIWFVFLLLGKTPPIAVPGID